MSEEAPLVEPNLERYRSFLRVQARVHLHPLVRRKLDASDLVQETLLEAHRDHGQFRGESPGEMIAWLKKILSRNLQNAIRDLRRQKRDIARERPLAEALTSTTGRFESWIAAEQASPSEIASDQERLLRLAEAIEGLSEPCQEALVLRYWQGESLSGIAARMERSPAAVAGLLHRGLKKLRETLARMEGRGES